MDENVVKFKTRSLGTCVNDSLFSSFCSSNEIKQGRRVGGG